MTQVVLNEDQVKAVSAANGPVELRDASGNLIGYATRPLSDDRVEEAKKRLDSDGPWLTTDQVMDHLNSLESE